MAHLVKEVWLSPPEALAAPRTAGRRLLICLLSLGIFSAAFVGALRPSFEALRVPRHVFKQLRVPNKPPKKRVPQTISSGRRLVKIESLMDVAEDMKAVKYQEAEEQGAGLPTKRKRRLRQKLTKWAQSEVRDEYEGAYGRITDYGGQVARWLPDVFKADGIWKEPLVADDLALLFDAFSADLETELAPVVVYGLQRGLKTAQLRDLNVILEAMATARHSYDGAYKVIGEFGALMCLDAPEDEVAEFGFAVALALQRSPKQCQLTLKEGLQVHLGQLPGQRVRLLAWALAEANVELPELGQAPKEVDPELAQHVWSTCSSLASQAGNRLISGWPLPLVESQVLSEEERNGLISWANEKELWRPSARHGSGDRAGQAIEGYPWTALLTSPHPTATALRQWVAKTFQAPLEHVEAVRLIRYRPGESAPQARSDARPEDDQSLWLSGQRLLTVMLQLNDSAGSTLFPELLEGQGLYAQVPGGNALVWPTVDAKGKPTTLAQRQALPAETERYVAVTWLRVGPAPGELGGAPA